MMTKLSMTSVGSGRSLEDPISLLAERIASHLIPPHAEKVTLNC